MLFNFGGETAVQNEQCSTHRVEVGDREHHRNGKKDNFLVNLASGFCFCEPRYVAAEMILYMRFCEMESEHASRGHHNSSVYDLFYFIIYFIFLVLEFVWTEKSWVYVPSVFLNIGDSSAKLCLH